MKAAIVSAILDPAGGGPAFVVRGHAEALRHHIDVDVLGLRSRRIDAPAKWITGAELYPEAWPSRWFRARGLMDAMRARSANWDVIHAHMLWDHPVWCSWRIARERCIPLIVTPHGSVNTPSRRGGLHKRAYRRLILDPLLRDAAFVHALNAHEETMLREFGVRSPIRIIPNGLPRAIFGMPSDPQLAQDAWPEIRGNRILLYLGRLAAGKGLDLLLDAWGKLGGAAKDWRLVVAGPDYRGYETQLRCRIAALANPMSVVLTGAVSGELKQSLFAAANCFVLPSLSEGLSMSLIEAMAARLPSVYTTACNLPELATAGGGWEISADVDELIGWLRLALATSPDSLRSSGARACAFGLREYTLESVAERLLRMYSDALGLSQPAERNREGVSCASS